MSTLAIVNQKGGVGKTTTAVTLGHGLAKRGELVLIVDLDAQGNVSDLLGLDKGRGVYRLLVEGVLDVTGSGRPGLDVVAGGKETAAAKGVLMGRSFRELTLRDGLRRLAARYDWVILDVEPGVGLLQVCALVASDYLLAPCSLEDLAVGGLQDLEDSVATLRDAGATQVRFLGVLPTFWERTTREGARQLEDLEAEYGAQVWPPIPKDVRARESPAYGNTLWEFARKCRALRGLWCSREGFVGGYVKVLDRLMREVG